MSSNRSESFQFQLSKQALNHSHHYLFMSSAEKVITIEDLLHEILLSLPTKSLLRFTCVSKQWLSIISSFHFRRLHTHRITSSSSSPSAIFLVGDSKKCPIYLSQSNNTYQNNKTVSSNFIPGGVVLHSCNGLICITLPLGYHVYNPCTCQYTIIPQPDHKKSGYLSALNLAFDPLKSDQFKLICVWEDMIEFSFYIYSSNTTTWKDSGESLDARHYRYGFPDYESSQYFFRNGVFLNGKIYWVSNTKPFLCFDTENEQFEAMPSTIVKSEKGRNIRYFGEYGGYIHLIEESNHGATCFNVLELRKNQSEWYTKYQIDVGFVIKTYPQVIDDHGDVKFHILSLLWEKDEEKMKILLSIPENIITFDFENETIVEILDVEPEHGLYKWYHAYKHLESFAHI